MGRHRRILFTRPETAQARSLEATAKRSPTGWAVGIGPRGAEATFAATGRGPVWTTWQHPTTGRVIERRAVNLSIGGTKPMGRTPRSRDLTRRVLDLPEAERIAVFEELRRDLAAAAPADPVDAKNARRAEALEILVRVAEHLTLDQDGRKALTMREFNAAPARVRGERSAEWIAQAFLGWSWAKRALLDGEIPPNLQQFQIRQGLHRRRHQFEDHLAGLRAWLATNPARTKRPDYERWREEENKAREERGQGEPRLVTSGRMIAALRTHWKDLVAGAPDPAFMPKALLELDPIDETAEPLDPAATAAEADVAKPAGFTYDRELIARCLRQLRQARDWSLTEAHKRSGVNRTVISELERGMRAEPTLLTMTKLAKAFGVSLDLFLTPDGRTGVREKPLRSGRRGKQSA
jgi:DNA-binding XRE family transcriptional regulator